MVSPPACVPSPMEEEAVSPPLNCVSVDVALPVRAKGYAKVEIVKQLSALPEASTPSGAAPAEQLVPLAARAVARPAVKFAAVPEMLVPTRAEGVPSAG